MSRPVAAKRLYGVKSANARHSLSRDTGCKAPATLPPHARSAGPPWADTKPSKLRDGRGERNNSLGCLLKVALKELLLVDQST